MISKKEIYKKQLVRKKMLSLVVFGIIFLISTIAFYFVNTSKAKNVLCLTVSVIDKECEIEPVKYELKVPQENDSYNTTMKFNQNGFAINKYTIINEDEFIKLQNLYEDKNVSEIKEEDNKDNIKKDDTQTIEITKEKNDIINLTEEQIENKKLYLVADYDYKEEKDKKLYNKTIYYTTSDNYITINGYMPQDSEISVNEVEKSDAENRIKKSLKDDKKDLNLSIAYDIKIISEKKEYEPEEFDKNVKVSIKGIEGKEINVWHIKNDNTVEKMETHNTTEDNSIEFETNSFSVYGIEVLNQTNAGNEQATNDSNSTDNNINDNNNTQNTVEQKNEEENKVSNSSTKKSAPSKAAARDLPHSVLEIDDYDSDYYYYKGKKYTDNINGSTVNTYNNLVKVTLNYYGYAQSDSSNIDKIGRISLTETQDAIKNIKCAPVISGNVTIELMENPFMDKPTGYGFGGWTTSLGTVSQDSKTLTYTLTAPASGDITVNLYANWTSARVVYLNPSEGCDNLISNGYDGSTPEKPLGSWQAACNRLYSLAGNTTNRSDRENNIIVLTGNIDSSINYTRPVTGTLTQTISSADATYTNNNGISTNTSLIITNGNPAVGSTALGGNRTTFTGNQVTSSLPAKGERWTITGSNGNYSIKNEDGYYLTASNNDNSTLSLSTTAFSSWSFNNNRLCYVRTSGSWWNYTTYYYYLYFNGNTWTFYERQTRSGNYGTRLYFHTYRTSNEVYEDKITTSSGNMANNTYYGTGNNRYNLALTVTSLYNHEDYRNNATITLTSSSYFDFTIHNDFQMDFVKINASGYTSNSDGSIFSGSYPRLTGQCNNVRIGRGMQNANTNNEGTTFANVIGGGVTPTGNSSSMAYKLIVETGKYSSIQGFNGSGGNSFDGIGYLTLGNDIDRASNNNNDLSLYYEISANSGDGHLGSTSNNKAFEMVVKSGNYGTDYFDARPTNVNSSYAGIYVGGYNDSNNTARDLSARHIIVEGGLIANVIGGLKVSGTMVETRIYVKGGEMYAIVGGAGVSTTYGNRMIQMTGGTVRYSVFRWLKWI